MPRISFNHLCTKLEHAAGSRAFKAESKILSSGEDFDMLRNVPANVGGILPGELKVAIMLRLLAGACYLDMIGMFHICDTTVFEVFHEAIGWVIKAFKFPFREMIEQKNWSALREIADDFGKRTKGTYNGCIGALDGLAVQASMLQYFRCPGSWQLLLPKMVSTR